MLRLRRLRHKGVVYGIRIQHKISRTSFLANFSLLLQVEKLLPISHRVTVKSKVGESRSGCCTNNHTLYRSGRSALHERWDVERLQDRTCFRLIHSIHHSQPMASRAHNVSSVLFQEFQLGFSHVEIYYFLLSGPLHNKKRTEAYSDHIWNAPGRSAKKKSFDNPPREQKKAIRKMEMDVEGRRAGKNISRWNTNHLEKSDHYEQKETENLHEIEVSSSFCWFKSLFSSVRP